MSFETIIEISFAAIFTSGLGTLFWARMNRLEAQIIDIRRTMATREDLAATRGDLAEDIRQFRTETKEDMRSVRGEMAGMRGEMAVMRSDLTHVALAVGANRPKPVEG